MQDEIAAQVASALTGSLLEQSWGGKEPVMLSNGHTRSFLEDGDQVTIYGRARGDGFAVGFGECCGTLLPEADR